MTMTPDAIARERDAFLERMLQSARGTFDLFGIYIGVRLGFYETLAAVGAQTSGELAARTGTAERYVREWLEQQTVAGVLTVDDEKVEARSRRFSLPTAYVEVLVDQESLNYLAPLARLVAGAVHPLAALLDAYRTGRGVPYADYGADLREGQAGINRAMFLKQLGSEWLPALPDVHARLLADPPARIAEAKKPDATLTLTEGSVAVGIGYSWGKGTLTYQGKKHPVKVEGLSVGEVGVTRATATGNVYNLKKLADFDGNYVAGGAEATVAGGAGVTAMKNQNGVVIELKSTTQGASLKLAAEGIKLSVVK